MAKILITGGSGMLGSHVALKAVELSWETWATYSSRPVEIAGCKMERLDITEPDRIRELFNRVKPDAVIHSAAQVRPDTCEVQKSEAFKVNVIGASNVISACQEIGSHLVHVSTDLVFDGERNTFRPEYPLCPVNYYGLTKAAAEAAAYAAETSWAIVRTSTIYGPRLFPFLNSYSDKVIESLRAGKKVPAFTDQRRCAVLAWNLADVLLEIADRKLTGIYHGVAPDSCTRYEFAVKIAEVFGLDQKLIDACSQYSVDAVAKRPETLTLDVTSTSQALNTRLIGWEEGILEMHKKA